MEIGFCWCLLDKMFTSLCFKKSLKDYRIGWKAKPSKFELFCLIKKTWNTNKLRAVTKYKECFFLKKIMCAYSGVSGNFWYLSQVIFLTDTILFMSHLQSTMTHRSICIIIFIASRHCVNTRHNCISSYNIFTNANEKRRIQLKFNATNFK